MSDIAFAPDVNAEKPPVDEAGQAEAARTAAATRLAKSAGKQPDEFLPKVTGDDEYAAVKPGTMFLDPEGQRRKKPWEVKSDEDFSAVPEGAEFIDPEGNLRQKPTYEGVNFTANTLYNMAVNDKERKKALELSYPGKVKQEGKEFYVDDDGRLLKPRGLTQTATGLMSGLASGAAPMAGAVGGEILGGLGGSLLSPGAGTLGGAVAGGATGAALGQGFNDAVLALAGVYARSGTEQAIETGIAGAAGGIGSGVGRVLAGAGPAIKGAAENAGPKAAANFLGADEKELRTAIELREKGVDVVPLSGWAKEAPHLQNLSEVLDPAFRTQKPLQQAAQKHYETQGRGILSGIGADTEGSLLNPTARASSKEAGESMILKAREELASADARLQAAFEARRQAAATGTPGPDKQALRRAEGDARKAAQDVIDVGFLEIQQGVKAAVKVSQAGSNSGELWGRVAEQIRSLRQGVISRAQQFYQQAYDASAGHQYATASLNADAEAFLAQVPDEFANAYPSLIRRLRSLTRAGEDEATGEAVRVPVENLSLAEAHQMRTIMRQAADWYKLPTDFKDGALKHFSNRLDNLIQDVPRGSPAEDAVRSLNATDDWYRDNIQIFNARELQTVISGLKAGEPADPQQLASVILKEGHTDLTRRILDIVGPNLAAGVRAADVQSMLDASRGLMPGQIDGRKFVNEVLGRHRSRMLETVHGEEQAGRLLRQAQYIEALEGRLDIPVRPSDTALDVIGRARVAADAAKEAGRTDPLAMIARETKRVENELKREQSSLRKEMRGDKLGKILLDPSVGAVEAADRILGSEDLILAAAARFGEKSPQFEMLRSVYAKRLLEGSMHINDKVAAITPEVQQIMFPGASKDQLITLAKEMDFLLSTRGMSSGTGKSIMATQRVEHPLGAIPGGRLLGKLLPGSEPMARAVLTKYYKFITEMTNNLAFMRWVEKGLKGDEAAREMTRQQVQRWMQRGGAVGAGAAESQVATPEQPQ